MVLFAGLGTLVALGAIFGIYMTATSSQAADPPRNIGLVTTPSAFFDAGGRSAVVGDVSPKLIKMNRGESASFSITLTHNASPVGFDKLTITAVGVKGLLGLPSYANTSSLEDSAELLEKGITAPGLVDLSTFVVYTPPEVTLNAGETKTITATVAIPPTFPDEMVGKSIHINPNLKIVEMETATADKRSEALLFDDQVTILIEG